jgi:hypothetical protein
MQASTTTCCAKLSAAEIGLADAKAAMAGK